MADKRTRSAGAAQSGPVPLARDHGRAASPAALSAGGLLEALTALAGAGSRADVAAAALPLLIEEPGVRACAVVGRDGERAVVLGSAGYGCGSMAPGAALALDAGLPVTEAVRTGRAVAQGAGPGWLALPFGGNRREGALLLSLTGAPPSGGEDRDRLQRLARTLGDALRRASAQEQAGQDLALVTSSLVRHDLQPTADLAVRSLPYDGTVGGDVAICVPDGRGGRWLVVADVCGCGLQAALVAHTVRTAVTSVAPYAGTPRELLRVVERAVLPETGASSFVTAVAARLSAGRLSVASAGHPVPLMISAGRVRALPVVAGQPLALETGPAVDPGTAVVDVPAGSVLLLHTDGLTDRRSGGGTWSSDPLDLLEEPLPGDLEELADHVLAAAERRGPAVDDVTLVLARLGS